MIFDIRALPRVGISMLGVLFLVANSLMSPYLAIVGVSLIALGLVLNVRAGAIKFRSVLPDLLKGFAIIACGFVVICLALGLMIAAGAESAAPVVLLVVLFGGGIALCGRFWLAYHGSLVSTLYNRWVKGKRDFQEAVWQSVRGELQESLATLDRYEAKTGADPETSAQRAFVLLLMNRLPEAALEAERSLAIARTATGLSARGQVLLAAGDAATARPDLEQAVQLGSKMWWIRINLAAAFVEHRHLDTAIAVLRGANRGAYRSASGALLLGDCYRLLGRQKQARQGYKEASRLAMLMPDNIPSGRGELGCAQVHLGRPDEAERSLLSALEHDVAAVQALYGLALLAQSRGDDDEIASALERLLALRSHKVVSALMDPLFTSLLSQDRFRELLTRAIAARDAVRREVLSRISNA